MVVAPAKTPQSIVQKLHNDLTSVLAVPEIKALQEQKVLTVL